MEQYERVIELDPAADKARYQLIGALEAMSEADQAVTLYGRRVAASPGDVREHRFLARACLAARSYDEARDVIDAGLGLHPDDAALIESRGDLHAAAGEADAALADWSRALELDPDNLSPLYARAFLLERQGRTHDAIDAWRGILEWSKARGNTLDTEWPIRELARLHAHPTPAGG